MPSAIRRTNGEELHLVADADYADVDAVVGADNAAAGHLAASAGEGRTGRA